MDNRPWRSCELTNWSLLCRGRRWTLGWRYSTADILRALKKLHSGPVKVGNIYRSTSWDAYKLKGTSEQTHGDIALIVKIHLETDKTIEGIAFLEAKRITHGSTTSSGSFSSIKWDRLKIYSDSSPAHYTILYDYLPINEKQAFVQKYGHNASDSFK